MKRPVFAIAVLLSAAAAHAGQACEPHKPGAADITQALNLAHRTAQALDTSGAEVVLIARAGQDLSAYGLRYSHLGYAYRERPAGAWRIVHKLNHCGTDHAALYRQGLADFFMDKPWRYEAALVVPEPAVQQALLPLLRDNLRAATLHTPAYSMVAYPWAQRYQQSNQWALETLAFALEDAARSRAQAQAWLRFKGYQPTTLRLPTFKRLGARLTAANVAFDDHPNERRFAGRIDTVTVDSVFAFVRSAGLAGEPQVVR
ncbi:MAG: DUF2145 domain-containing protein [Pseudomonadota bacterium]